MLAALRQRLRKIGPLHRTYLRLKRGLTGELVGMTSKSEQDFLTRFGNSRYVGTGEVIDLGCWLGSTTISLARGLSANPAFAGSGRKIRAFDAFRWYEGMDEAAAGARLAKSYLPGDDFVGEFRLRTEPYREIIDIRKGDLAEARWDGPPIEFLLVDAMKSFELANAIVRGFYPKLMPGTSLVMHQDFAHFFTVWIHLIQWRLRSFFEFDSEVPGSSSVVFRLTAPVPESLLGPFGFEDFSDSEAAEAIDYSLGLVSEEKHANILAAGAMYFVHTGRPEAALARLGEIGKRGFQGGELDVVRRLAGG